MQPKWQSGDNPKYVGKAGMTGGMQKGHGKQPLSLVTRNYHTVSQQVTGTILQCAEKNNHKTITEREGDETRLVEILNPT